MKLIVTIFLSCVFSPYVSGQVGIGTSNPDPSAALDVSSDSKGLLVPHMTRSQRLGIDKPATGLLIYQQDDSTGFYYNAGTPDAPNWLNLSAYVLQQNINTNGKWISPDGEDNGIYLRPDGVGIGTNYVEGRLNVRQSAAGSKLTTFLDQTGIPRWHTQLVNGTLNVADANGEDFALAVKPGGQVGIGTGFPHSRLGIRAASTGDLLSFSQNSSDLTKWHLSLANSEHLNFAETGVADGRLFLKSGGQVGINNMNPTEALDVKGNIKYSGTLDMGVRIFSQGYVITPNGGGNFSIGCPTGTRLIGGGGGQQIIGTPSENTIVVNYSGPHPNDDNFWRLVVANNGGTYKEVVVYVICAKVK
jgi:hypothetical protein